MRPGGALTLAVYSGFSADINSGSSLGELGTYRKILKNMSWDKTQTIPADLSGMIPQGRCSALASEKLRCQAQHVENLKSHIPNPIYTHI